LKKIGAPEAIHAFVDEWRQRVLQPALQKLLSTRERGPEDLARLVAKASRDAAKSHKRLLRSIAEMMHVAPESVAAASAEGSANTVRALTHDHAANAFEDPAATNAYLWSLEELAVASRLPAEVVPPAARDLLRHAAFGLMALDWFALDPSKADREAARGLAQTVRAMILRAWSLHRAAMHAATPATVEAPPTVDADPGSAADEDVPEVDWE
jgi:hypothetical protein